jgi:hypothetical protein
MLKKIQRIILHFLKIAKVDIKWAIRYNVSIVTNRSLL